jgi:ribosomal protein S16
MWVIKSRKMRWAGHMARMGDNRSVYRVLVRKSEDPDPGVDGKIILQDGVWRPGLD